mmetsp:Transcript_24099/g.37831  ORF Transcript_24099/g.37831 Transcript_24099/m.37831 type:complete len:163 (+) Transcript_24099:274-762(+)
MPKKGKKGSSKAREYATEEECKEQFGVKNGQSLVTPAGMSVLVQGMGKADKKLYVNYTQGEYTTPLEVESAQELEAAGFKLDKKAEAASISRVLQSMEEKFAEKRESLLLANTVLFDLDTSSSQAVKEYFVKHFDPVEAAKKREAAEKKAAKSAKKKGKKKK